MQQPNFTPAHAQHTPAGWNFPTLTVPVAPNAAHAPVTGGGAATSTVTRLRWGRLLPVFVAIALLAFGVWSISNDGSTPSNKTVSGGGTSESDIEIARSARTDLGTTDSTDDEAAAETSTTPDAAAPATAPPSDAIARAGAGTTTNSTRRPARRPGARRVVAGGGGAAIAARPARAAAAPAAAPAANRGGGTTSGELPLTGIETWIAGILGAMLLLVGICVHVNAVRIAATAMLYRRGILLRPVECARLAQEQGLPQTMRVWLSNALHKLLEEPANGDFVATRMAR